MIQTKDGRIQNQDLSIEAYMSERIDRNPIIAAIYARVNPLDRKCNASVRTKVCNCWNYCSEKGWKVEYIFVDRQERTGKTSKLNFESMMRKAKCGDFDVIVFWNLDKFDSSIFSVSGKPVNDQWSEI